MRTRLTFDVQLDLSWLMYAKNLKRTIIPVCKLYEDQSGAMLCLNIGTVPEVFVFCLIILARPSPTEMLIPMSMLLPERLPIFWDRIVVVAGSHVARILPAEQLAN